MIRPWCVCDYFYTYDDWSTNNSKSWARVCVEITQNIFGMSVCSPIIGKLWIKWNFSEQLTCNLCQIDYFFEYLSMLSADSTSSILFVIRSMIVWRIFNKGQICFIYQISYLFGNWYLVSIYSTWNQILFELNN